MSILNLYKPLGKTPLQTLEDYREGHSELVDTPMVYAGRLDPMAHGVLLVLAGDDRFRLKEFLGLEKTYEATFLLGFSTDTFDILGIPEISIQTVEETKITQNIKKLIGEHVLPFPVYSAYRVQGKPLHWWAKSGRLAEIEIPLKNMNVFSVDDIRFEKLSAQNILSEINRRISLVEGDFRQGDILHKWEGTLNNRQDEVTLVKAKFVVGSGTYIRSIASLLGESLNSGVTLFDLKRTTVGGYSVESSVRCG